MLWFWLVFGIILLFGFVVFRGAPYVPSHRRQVERAFKELYPVGEKDTVVDVGSGDGIILRLVRKRGGNAIGYELNPVLVLLSSLLSRGDKKVRIHLADFWLVQLPTETTLVYGFLVSRDSKKMTIKMQQEANRLGHSLYFMTYGAGLDHEQTGEKGAHKLYKFSPLQINQPQV
jgi:hypothetical protein